MPALDNRTVVVTGANRGIGFATATQLARAGAHVVLAVRDIARGNEAARRIGGSNEVRRLDLADQESIREFADEWTGEIAILVNNAGIAWSREGRTKDGFELQFGTNYLGPFALTNRLLPHITDRVVTVSSGAHKGGTLDFDDLYFAESGYKPMKAYSRSKLANLLFTLELERRLRHAGSTVRAMAAHPGYAASELGTADLNKFMVAVVHLAVRMFAQPPEQGALPTLFAATQDLPGASYVGPDGIGEAHGSPTLVGRSALASDVQVAQRLWEVSEKLTGVGFGLS